MSARRASLVALLLAGAIGGFAVRPHRVADASTYLMMADSLWHDGDLAYEPRDLARADALALEGHPGGLFLVERSDGGFRYGKPPFYALAALPFYALLGIRGFFVMNGMLLAGVVLVGGLLLADRLPWPRALAASACAVAASVTVAYLHWIDPFLLASFLVAAALLAWRDRRPALCGACLAALGSVRAPYLLLTAAPVALYLGGARWQALARFVLGALAAVLVLVAVTAAAGGEILPYVGTRRLVFESVPFAAGPGDRGRGFLVDHGANLGTGSALGVAALLRSNLYFWLGRFGGVIPYAPSFVACLFWTERWTADRLIWLAAALGVGLALQLAMPFSFAGGAHALGNRYFVLLPVSLAMIDSTSLRRGRVIAAAGLVSFVAPVAVAPAYYTVHAGEQIAAAPIRWLPFEWTQAAAMDLPARYPGGVYALTDRQHDWEPEQGGVWTVGDARSEFVLVRRGDTPPVVRLWSHLPRAFVDDGSGRREVALAPDGGAEVTLRPMARFEDRSRDADPRIGVYHLVVESPGGFRPVDLGLGADRRYLGVLVRPVP